MKDGLSPLEIQFLHLLQLALGRRDRLCPVPSDAEWEDLFQLAAKHCVIGLCVPSLADCPEDLRLCWMGHAERIADHNRRMNDRCRQLCDKFTRSGYRNCILKGQGLALLYPHPQWRQPGDIDVWVSGGRKRLVEMVLRVTGQRGEVMYHHIDFPVFPDAEVELHFTPSWMFCPWHNRRLQHWFREQESKVSTGNALGVPLPGREFNAVFVLVHIFRHVFDEGIGLRQIIDYFYVLRDAQGQLDEVPALLRRFGLYRFARALMWVMGEALAMPRAWMPVEPDERTGRWLLAEILQAGNFGHHDERNADIFTAGTIRRFHLRWLVTARRLRVFPNEALWEMPWRIGHFLWRWGKGYLHPLQNNGE